MKALGMHKGNFTWARGKYYGSDDPADKAKFARYMAKHLREGHEDRFTTDQITSGNGYPSEVEQYLSDLNSEDLPEVSEEQAKKEIAESVDTADVICIGQGEAAVYRYGYRCCPDRVKVGYATGDTLQRINEQIFTSTPDKPVLQLEIKTNDCRALERAIHAVLRVRGRKIVGGGDEWFRATRDEIIAIYEFICGSPVVQAAAD